MNAVYAIHFVKPGNCFQAYFDNLHTGKICYSKYLKIKMGLYLEYLCCGQIDNI
jgi:hypothetical protein